MGTSVTRVDFGNRLFVDLGDFLDLRHLEGFLPKKGGGYFTLRHGKDGKWTAGFHHEGSHETVRAECYVAAAFTAMLRSYYHRRRFFPLEGGKLAISDDQYSQQQEQGLYTALVNGEITMEDVNALLAPPSLPPPLPSRTRRREDPWFSPFARK